MLRTTRISGLAFLALLLGFAGCKDNLADPTQGFIDVDTGGVQNVTVFLDGEVVGTDVAELGPLDAGEYVVRVERECFSSDESRVQVVAGEHRTASLTLTPGEFGAISVAVFDELTGAEVTGARIELELTADTWTDTGEVTPAVLAQVPCGPVGIRVRTPDSVVWIDSDEAQVLVVPQETLDYSTSLGPPRAVLGEMFTFIACAGCPDAAEVLTTLHLDNPGRFFAIEWHSNSFFPLFDDRWEDREQFYSPTVTPKPATVVQGGAGDSPVLMIGSADAELAEYRARFAARVAECGNDCPMALRVEADDRLSPTVRALWRSGSPPSDLVLTVVLVEHHIDDVGGNQDWFDFVPRDWVQAPLALTAGQVDVQNLTLVNGGGFDPDELNVVAFAQSSTTGEIHAVSGTIDPLPTLP